MDHDLKIVIWNVRGLNARARRTAICSLIVTSGASIVCLQETKMALICSSVVLEALGSEFDEYVYLLADDTRGGILLAWKSRVVTITNPEFTTHTLSAQVTPPSSQHPPWWLSIVYGPQLDDEKIEFLRELRDLRASCPGPWMLCGDFNLIYRDEDKNNNNLDRHMMRRFKHLLNDLALKEVYLNGRRYTWSSEHSPPTLVHLDLIINPQFIGPRYLLSTAL
uniref:Endonuclease/exonuclease/phosphatase domain-containing protein n=1 Tax=Aegilops tauschii subsp. strangulata TaxID=200361 RepID=A0A453FS81_AEGTS